MFVGNVMLCLATRRGFTWKRSTLWPTGSLRQGAMVADFCVDEGEGGVGMRRFTYGIKQKAIKLQPLLPLAENTQ